MNVLSLFSGIGGLELGLERAGMNVVGQVEINPYCRAVLEQHWPDVPRHDDVRTTMDWWSSEPRPRVDLVCGGYPCQPFFADVLRALRPRYSLLENVPSHVRLGFDSVLADLAELGFDAEWSVVYAATVGASHRRPRLFVLAYSHESELGRRGGLPVFAGGGWNEGQVSDTHWCRTHVAGTADAVSWPGEPGVGRMADGVSAGVDRNRLYALGNAVVPQVSEAIGSHLLAVVA